MFYFRMLVVGQKLWLLGLAGQVRMKVEAVEAKVAAVVLLVVEAAAAQEVPQLVDREVVAQAVVSRRAKE